MRARRPFSSPARTLAITPRNKLLPFGRTLCHLALPMNQISNSSGISI
jgi:hypothetical protein